MTSNTTIFAIAFIALTLVPIEVRAQIRPLDTETPAYIDVELSEITVSEDLPAATINLHRTGDFRQYSRIHFSTEEITATEGQDYQGTGGTVTFQPGEGMKQITVPLLRDEHAEGEEGFRVILSDPGPNTLLMRDSVAVTIREGGPRLQITANGPDTIALAWDGLSYGLERTSDTKSWEAVACERTENGTRCEVVLTTEALRFIYRLKSN
jgi:hypothetical protein